MKAVVLGAGITGLSTAAKLAQHADVTVLEKSHSYGGLAATFRHKEFLLDYGPHKIYTQLPVMEEFREIMGDRLLDIPKKSRVRLQGTYFDFPVSMKELLLKLSPLTSMKLGFSYAGSIVGGKKEGNYEDYLTSRFGRQTYELVFKGYGEKIWGNPREVSADMARTRVAVPSLFEILKRVVVGDKGQKELSAKTFYYPKKGVVEMSDRFAEIAQERKGKIILDATVEGFALDGNRISAVRYANDGKLHEISADTVVSTLPLHTLVKLLGKAPDEVLEAVDGLKYKDLVLLYIVADKKRLFTDNWLFFPEKKYVFNRISEQKGFSPFMGPEDKTVLCVEITHQDYLKADDERIYERCLHDLEEAGILKRKDVVEYFVKRIPKVYPIYDLQYKQKLERIFGYLDTIENLYSVGRNGVFSYTGTMDCIDMGFKTAELIGKGERKHWKALRESFYDYLVID